MGCAQGWIDVTYLSPDGRFRLSRGNKGTLFVLVKDASPRERLEEALRQGGWVGGWAGARARV